MSYQLCNQGGKNKMETQTNETNIKEWLVNEAEKANENNFDGETLPSLILEEGKVTTFTVNFEKPFSEWRDAENGVIKKIIPVLHEGEKKNFWLNIKNPLYSEIVNGGIAGQSTFKVMRTGQQKNTRYNIVKE